MADAAPIDYAAIAAVLGVTRQRAHQLAQRGVLKLRLHFADAIT